MDTFCHFSKITCAKALCLIALMAFMLSVQNATATLQSSDVLIYEGERYTLSNYPLESHPQIDSLRQTYFFEGCSMGTIKGYTATWLVENKQLFLVEIRTCHEPDGYVSLSNMFGNRFVDGRVEVDWYSGVLYAPYGKRIFVDVNHYLVIYEKELSFTVDSGSVGGVQHLDNSATHISTYHENEKALMQYIYSHINWEGIPDLEKLNERVYVHVETGSTPQPSNVKIARACNHTFLNEEAVRVIASIPDWNVYYVHGQPKIIQFILPVLFNPQMKDKYGRTNGVEK